MRRDPLVYGQILIVLLAHVKFLLLLGDSKPAAFVIRSDQLWLFDAIEPQHNTDELIRFQRDFHFCKCFAGIFSAEHFVCVA